MSLSLCVCGEGGDYGSYWLKEHILDAYLKCCRGGKANQERKKERKSSAVSERSRLLLKFSKMELAALVIKIHFKKEDNFDAPFLCF